MIGQTIDYTFYVRNRRDVRHADIPEDSNGIDSNSQLRQNERMVRPMDIAESSTIIKIH